MYSKKKHNISFAKPAEPAFITRMKQAAGFIEGPSVDTKKEQRPEMDDDDGEDRDDEKPTVVIMNEGDLSQEEADLYTEVKKEVEKAIEEKNKKADLSQRVIFKRKKEVNDDKTASDTANPKEVKKKKKSKSTKSVLSFNDEDEEEE